jgi:hypothetical protein
LHVQSLIECPFLVGQRCKISRKGSGIHSDTIVSNWYVR